MLNDLREGIAVVRDYIRSFNQTPEWTPEWLVAAILVIAACKWGQRSSPMSNSKGDYRRRLQPHACCMRQAFSWWGLTADLCVSVTASTSSPRDNCAADNDWKASKNPPWSLKMPLPVTFIMLFILDYWQLLHPTKTETIFSKKFDKTTKKYISYCSSKLSFSNYYINTIYRTFLLLLLLIYIAPSSSFFLQNIPLFVRLVENSYFHKIRLYFWKLFVESSK